MLVPFVQVRLHLAEKRKLRKKPMVEKYKNLLMVDTQHHRKEKKFLTNAKQKAIALLLLDVERLFYARSPDGLSAPGMFWDDLHPTRQGHQLIADALYPEVARIASERLAP